MSSVSELVSSRLRWTAIRNLRLHGHPIVQRAIPRITSKITTMLHIETREKFGKTPKPNLYNKELQQINKSNLK